MEIQNKIPSFIFSVDDSFWLLFKSLYLALDSFWLLFKSLYLKAQAHENSKIKFRDLFFQWATLSGFASPATIQIIVFRLRLKRYGNLK